MLQVIFSFLLISYHIDLWILLPQNKQKREKERKKGGKRENLRFSLCLLYSSWQAVSPSLSQWDHVYIIEIILNFGLKRTGAITMRCCKLFCVDKWLSAGKIFSLDLKSHLHANHSSTTLVISPEPNNNNNGWLSAAKTASPREMNEDITGNAVREMLLNNCRVAIFL